MNQARPRIPPTILSRSGKKLKRNVLLQHQPAASATARASSASTSTSASATTSTTTTKVTTVHGPLHLNSSNFNCYTYIQPKQCSTTTHTYTSTSTFTSSFSSLTSSPGSNKNEFPSAVYNTNHKMSRKSKKHGHGQIQTAAKTSVNNSDTSTIIDASNVEDYTQDMLLVSKLNPQDPIFMDIALKCIHHWSKSKSLRGAHKGCQLLFRVQKLEWKKYMQELELELELEREHLPTSSYPREGGDADRDADAGEAPFDVLVSYMEEVRKRSTTEDRFLDSIAMKLLERCWNVQEEAMAKILANENHAVLARSHHHQHYPVITVTHKACNIVLDALAKSRKKDNIELMESIIDRMHKASAPGSTFGSASGSEVPHHNHSSEVSLSSLLSSISLQPNVTTYNSLLYAYSQKKGKGNAQKCEDMLRTVQRLQESQSNGEGGVEGDDDDGGGDEIITYVGNVTYNIVIRAWARSAGYDRNAASKAEALLREMQQKYSESQKKYKIKNKKHLEHHLHRQRQQYHLLRPTLVSFTTVIDAWARASSRGDVDAASRADAVFELLLELSRDDPRLKPNSITMSSIQNAWAQSSLPGAAEKTEQLLRRMMMGGQMISHHEHGDFDGVGICDSDGASVNSDDEIIIGVKPTMINFSICIRAWADSGQKGSALKALKLLDEMLELSEKGYDTAPDIGTFNSILLALSKDSSCDESRSSRAEEILRQIHSLNLVPEANTYKNILRCCSTTRSKDMSTRRNTIRIAVNMLLQMKKSSESQSDARVHVVPDCWMFNFYIKTCDRLSEGSEKLKLIKSGFQYCIECGQLKPPVLSLLKNVLPPPELRKLLKLDKDANLRFLMVKHLPPEWSNGSGSAASGPSATTPTSKHNRT